MAQSFGSAFYITLALLLVLLFFMWRWYLKKSERSGIETFMVVLISIGSLSPVFFLVYLLLVRR
jgi:cytochrome bd-type quinol oxidase subunit 2